jgi:murein DD-endopeptidase MepM/ murein hydrolase activator NlpD
MNASTTRRQLFGSAAALVGAGAWWWRGMSAPAGALEATSELDAAAVALHAAVRLRLVSEVGFPVQLPGELVLLDNFGDNRLFGSGAHQGIDIGRRDGQPGHPVVACVDGVLVTQEVLGRNQGNSWVLQGANGDAYRYHHLDEFSPDLAVGSAVVRGQVLGTMGSTGNPSAPHLHFEVRRGGPIGTPVDPVPLLPLPLDGVTVV